MRLYLEKDEDSEKNKENYFDVYFWSFVKCHFLAGLGLSLIIILGYAAVLLILYVLGLIF